MGRDIFDYAEQYLKAPFLKENVEYRRKCVIEQMNKFYHKKILEIGCGMFPLFQYLEGEYDEYYIVEPSEVFVENAKNIANEFSGRGKVHVYEGFFEEQKCLKNKEFDFIVCSSLLHEVTDESNFLFVLKDIAKEATVIHINVPNALSLHRLIAKEMGLIQDIHELSATNTTLQQREVYDIQSLSKKVEQAGFEILSAGSYFIKPFTHKQMDEMIEREIINQQVLDGLWGLTKYFPEYGSEIYVNIKKKK